MTPAEAAEAVKVQVQTDKERIEQQVIARYPMAGCIIGPCFLEKKKDMFR